MNTEVRPTLKTVNTDDVNLVSKTGLGCGVDIIGVLGIHDDVKCVYTKDKINNF